MALNQFGLKREAVGHLRDADRVFMQMGDDSGRSWALVSLAEAYADSGADEDPEPILRRALTLAQRSGDRRAERRGWKQLAVLCRYRGQPAEALDAIVRALEGELTTHTRANYLLELGHLKAWLGDYAASTMPTKMPPSPMPNTATCWGRRTWSGPWPPTLLLDGTLRVSGVWTVRPSCMGESALTLGLAMFCGTVVCCASRTVMRPEPPMMWTKD